MCGIHFTISNNKQQSGLSRFMKDAFLANQVRGVDSSGVFQVQDSYSEDGARKVELSKKAVSGTDFVEFAGVSRMIGSCASALATVGHVRAATHGSIVDRNSHPFISIREDGSRIIGVHNGSLVNWKHKQGGDEYEVDSQWLYSRIAKDGIAAFDAIEGAFALVWYDSRMPDHLMVARNKDRPLYWAVTEDNKGMIAASELGMLGWLAERNGIKLGKWVADEYFSFPEERHLYKINMQDLNDITKTELPKLDSYSTRYTKMYSTHTSPRTTYTADSWEEDRTITRLTGILKVEVSDVERQALARRLATQAPMAKDPDDFDPVTRTMELIERETKDLEAAEKASTIDLSELSEEERSEIAGFLGTTSDLLNLGKSVNLEDPDAEVGVVDDRNFEYLHLPPQGTASSVETERAKDLGIYGLCVKFFGILFDDEVNEMYGEFRTREGGALVSYDSVVRATTTGMAKGRYSPDKTTASDMVVVGITKPRNLRSKPYIILEERSKAKAQNVYNHPATSKPVMNAQDMQPATHMLH